MARIVITGGTGLIGSHLTGMLLNKGHQVVVFTRSPGESGNRHLEYAAWDPAKGSIDEKAISTADFIIHLAGAGVADKRWSTERKQEIAESRTRSAELLVNTLQRVPNNVKGVISASAIGWYGPDSKASRQNGFSEEAPADDHFLGETCRRWEESISPVKNLGIRLVTFRIGIVLAEDGGALQEFSKPLKFGFATIMGHGEQVVSWIHVEDLCRMFVYAIENTHLHGVYNAVAPSPVTNKELVLTIAKKRRGKTFIPVHVPSFALKIALGEMSIEVLKSATVNSDKIRQAGFTFLYPTVTAALHLK